MTYLMQHAAEGERIRATTDPLVLRHHLDWAGLEAGDAFVDFGCASGEAVREATRRVAWGSVTGVDADANTLRYAQAESDRLLLDRIAYRQAWIDRLGSSGLETDSHDHAWARFFLEYRRDPLSAVREMARVVRPGGKVTLIDIDGNGIWHHPLPASWPAWAARRTGRCEAVDRAAPQDRRRARRADRRGVDTQAADAEAALLAAPSRRGGREGRRARRPSRVHPQRGDDDLEPPLSRAGEEAGHAATGSAAPWAGTLTPERSSAPVTIAPTAKIAAAHQNAVM